MIFRFKGDFDNWTWKWVALIVFFVVLINAAIYSAIGLGIYFLFQWLGQQL